MASLCCQLFWDAMIMTLLAVLGTTNYKDVAGQLAPCTEVASAVLCDSAGELSGRVESGNCHSIDTVIGSLCCLDPQATQLPRGTWLSHRCLPSSQYTSPSDLCHLPSFTPAARSWKGLYQTTCPDGLTSFPECICGHALPRTFPYGSLHLPKRRCVVPFGMPSGAQDICTEMADMTWDYFAICTNGKKPGRTPENC